MILKEGHCFVISIPPFIRHIADFSLFLSVSLLGQMNKKFALFLICADGFNSSLLISLSTRLKTDYFPSNELSI